MDGTDVELARLLEGLDAVTGEAATTHAGDASHAVPGVPLAVVFARDADEVSRVLSWAGAHRIPVTPRGAGTGVSGGGTAIDGGLVLSTARMDRILELRPEDRLAVVEPGVIVADLDAAARRHGLMYAPDPASVGIASIGGTIATNAGGFRCLAHGVTSDAVAALQVVLADGRIVRTGAASRKNVAGYDLTRLIVGSEGTLGVVTEATVRLVPVPRGERRTFQAAFPTLAAAGAAVGGVMAGSVTPELLELLDRKTVGLLAPKVTSTLDPGAAATLIGQVAGVDVDDQIETLRALFASHGGTDVAVAADDSLLEARRQVRPVLSDLGGGLSTTGSDAAVPPSRLVDLLARIEELEAAEGLSVSVAAHAGDGNIHAAVALDARDPAQAAAAERVVAGIGAAAVALGGTITGEHGVGSLKAGLLDAQLDPAVRELQRSVKAAFDPAGILNPGRGI